MSPQDMAELHARAFTDPRPWSAAEIASLLSSRHVFATCEPPAGFALTQEVAGEAEILTIAVAPEAQRQGVGRRLLTGIEETARRRGAARIQLEVAADNAAALALYAGAGYAETARRRGYYRRAGTATDALILSRSLAPG